MEQKLDYRCTNFSMTVVLNMCVYTIIVIDVVMYIPSVSIYLLLSYSITNTRRWLRRHDCGLKVKKDSVLLSARVLSRSQTIRTASN